MDSSLIDPPPMFDDKKEMWFRGKITNVGDRTAHNCRLKITEVLINGKTVDSDIINGYLQWQGGRKGTATINPEEHFLFDVACGHMKVDKFNLISFIGDQLISKKIERSDDVVVTIRAFGDNFKATRPLRRRIKLGKSDEDPSVDPV